MFASYFLHSCDVIFGLLPIRHIPETQVQREGGGTVLQSTGYGTRIVM